MKTLCTAVIKGGTGKTATAAALAQAAVKDGKRVLAIDLDPQANLTRVLGADAGLPGAYNVLSGSPAAEGIQDTDQGIKVIAGSPDLAVIKIKQGSAMRLLEALEPVKRKYDICIIDTPPSMGDLLFNALYAANLVLVPLETDLFSLQGLYQICDLVEQIQAHGKRVKVAGCILTRFDGRSKLNQHIKELIQEAGEERNAPLIGLIRSGIAMREAMALSESIFKYAPKSKPAADYQSLYKELFCR